MGCWRSPSELLSAILGASRIKLAILSVVVAAAGANDQLDLWVKTSVERANLTKCELSALYMVRWDERGMPSAYALASQGRCTHNHSRAKALVAGLYKASFVYTEDDENPTLMAQHLAGRAALFWVNEHRAMPQLFPLKPDGSCAVRVFALTTSPSDACSVVLPNADDNAVAREVSYRARRGYYMMTPWKARRPKVYIDTVNHTADAIPRGSRSCVRLPYRRDLEARKVRAKHFPYSERELRTLIESPQSIHSYFHMSPRFALYRYALEDANMRCHGHNLLQAKLAAGLVVFVVSHPDGLSSWWEQQHLLPYVHFVPVKPSLVDIIDKVKYYEKHPDAALAIAARAQRAAVNYTEAYTIKSMGSALLRQVTDSNLGLVRPYEGTPDDMWRCIVGNGRECDRNLWSGDPVRFQKYYIAPPHAPKPHGNQWRGG